MTTERELLREVKAVSQFDRDLQAYRDHPEPIFALLLIMLICAVMIWSRESGTVCPWIKRAFFRSINHG